MHKHVDSESHTGSGVEQWCSEQPTLKAIGVYKHSRHHRTTTPCTAIDTN